MKKLRIWIPLLLVILLLAGCWLYQQRFATVGEARYEKTIEAIDLSGTEISDVTQLQAFPGLKQIDLRGTGLSCKEYDMVKGWFPEAQILWDIPFQGTYYDMGTESLTLTALTEEDLSALAYFTELKSVSAEGCPDYQALHELRQLRPELEITYQVPVAGSLYSYDVSGLTLPGESVEELFAVLPYFPELQSVSLTEPLAPVDRILALREAFPEVEIFWSLDLGGVIADEYTEQLDLTGIPMTVERIEAALPYLLNVTFIDMTDCGISNEEMDALNRRHETVKIVWTVDIGQYFRLRTDATSFMPTKEGIYVSDSILYNLRYCTDMIAIDLGHKRVTNIEFVAFMPHLKYLLLGETLVRDLTPLTGLTELVYLELFLTNLTECDALLTLTALEDLNISYTSCDAEVLAQMTWLKNLWWACPTALGWQTLPDALPDTHIVFYNKSSTGNGWRTLPNYYAQRDIFGMHYMTG